MDGWLIALLFSMFPYVSQTGPDALRFENDCGAAVASMVILATGGDYYSPDELMGNRQPEDRLRLDELRNILAKHGIASTVNQNTAPRPGDIILLDATYYNGTDRQPGFWAPHYVVFLFADGDYVTVQDPLYGAHLRIDRVQFEKARKNIASKSLVVDGWPTPLEGVE